MLKSQQAFFILYIKKRRKERCIFVETTENKPSFLSSPPVYQLMDFHIQPAVDHQGNVQKKTRELLTKMKLQRDVWMILAACLSQFITLIYPDVPPLLGHQHMYASWWLHYTLWCLQLTIWKSTQWPTAVCPEIHIRILGSFRWDRKKAQASDTVITGAVHSCRKEIWFRCTVGLSSPHLCCCRSARLAWIIHCK